MRFLVLEEPASSDGKQQFIPPLTPNTLMRQLGANIRMRESGDVLELEDDSGKIHTEKLVRERSGHVHNRLDSFCGRWLELATRLVCAAETRSVLCRQSP